MATVNESRLQLYLDAEAAILAGGQSVRIGERQVTFADLTEIRAEISRLQRLVAREQEAARPNRLSGFAQADFGGEW